jgi:death-on-curing family protein
MKWIFVTVDQVIEAHAVLLRRFGGLEGGGHRGEAYEGVEAATSAVENAYYDDVYELAAAYAVYMVQGHVFLDGNKRAASAAMLDFLRLNHARTGISAERVVSIMVELQKRSEGGENAGSLIQWIASCLRSRRRR